MKRDADGDIVVTEAEFRADTGALLTLAGNERVRLLVEDESGRVVMTTGNRPSQDEIRESLMEAIVGCAQRLRSCVGEDSDEAEAALFAAVDALEDHDRQEVLRWEAWLREHPFTPGGDGWGDKDPREC